MIYILMGHRGAGKTQFLQRVALYYRRAGLPVRTYDLDEQIVVRARKSVQQIFETEGEKGFRGREERVFQELIKTANPKEDFFIALGAGFQFGLPIEAHPIWVRRATDAGPRIFVAGDSRPRLNPKVTPSQEYLERFPSREAIYGAMSYETWQVAEGFLRPNAAEENYVMTALAGQPDMIAQPALSATLTLLPENFRQAQGRFQRWLKRRLAWNGLRFELRDDLLKAEEVGSALEILPENRIVFAIRSKEGLKWIRELESRKFSAWDVPLEYASEVSAKLSGKILSLHRRAEGETIATAAVRLEEARKSHGAEVLKLAIPIHNLKELHEGHVWAQEAPAARAFLPRSTTGRWRWYRTLQLGKAPLEFIREGQGSNPDQPYLFEALHASEREWKKSTQFAAVLGDPVHHSLTPAEHDVFFAAQSAPVVAIEIPETEFDQIDVLPKIGLHYAAVTSPHKQSAGKLVGEPAVNTLYWSQKNQKWAGANTDTLGFRAAIAQIGEPVSSIGVWGGGGTLLTLQAELATAFPSIGSATDVRFYSARTGEPRPGQKLGDFYPDLVIWAVGRSRAEVTKPAPIEWHPKVVLDLQYSEDSPGREFAVTRGSRYISGEAMFRAQADGQRRFWNEQDKQE